MLYTVAPGPFIGSKYRICFLTSQKINKKILKNPVNPQNTVCVKFLHCLSVNLDHLFWCEQKGD